MNNLNIPAIEPEAGSSGVAQESNMGVKPLAFRVAAGILLTSSVLTLVGLFFGSAPNVIALVIDVWLAISLLRLNIGARSFTLFRAYAGAILWPILLFVQNEFAVALILTVIQLAYCGSLILVLQTETKNWKIYLSLGIFVVFVLCAMSGLYLLAFIGSFGQ
jgi:hypothetical protein